MMHTLTNHRPVSVLFSDQLYSSSPVTSGEVSNAIACVAKENTAITIDCCKKRFSAGSYFACGHDIPLEAVSDVYCNREQIFPNAGFLETFLATVGRNPTKSRYIHLLPNESPDANVVVLLVNTSQASRVLGLSAYTGQLSVDLICAAPTCASLFRPLLQPDRIHVNFVDYFDRDYQARGLFDESELLLSMRSDMYQRLLAASPHSAHGAFIPHDIPVFHGE